ncbi:MAG: replication protein [Carnobacterium maltaromaticum]
MTKERRSNKWAFLIYKESAPDNYLEILNGLHVPFVLSPWHDKDIYSDTGELKKSHKHGAFYFDSLKSYTQVSELVSDKLNGPAHVEVVMSPKGMFDYFTHAENPSKTPYDIENIESGAGFELDKFLLEQNTDNFMNDVIDIIEENNFMEFENLVRYARENNYLLLGLIVERTYFFAKYLDSRRYSKGKKPYKQQEEKTDE